MEKDSQTGDFDIIAFFDALEEEIRQENLECPFEMEMEEVDGVQYLKFPSGVQKHSEDKIEESFKDIEDNLTEMHKAFAEMKNFLLESSLKESDTKE